MSEVQDVNEGNRISNKSGVQDDIQLTAKSFFYTWTISNFFECLKFSDAKILSPEFEFAGANWRLWLQAVCKNDNLDKIKIRLLKSEKCDSGYYIKYKFRLRNADGSCASKEAGSNFVGESICGHRLSFKYEKNKNSSSFVVKDKLTVECDLLVLASVAKRSNDQPKSLLSKPVNKAKDPNSSRGLIRSRSRSRMPNIANKPIRSFNLRSNVIEIIIPVFLTYVLSMHICSDEISMNDKLLLNMSEVNELIIDSTLKIKSIAEALNLTDVKVKSSELLAWYHENYNITDRNFVNSNEEKLSFVNSDHPILNVSSSDMYETTIVNDTIEFIDDEH